MEVLHFSVDHPFFGFTIFKKGFRLGWVGHRAEFHQPKLIASSCIAGADALSYAFAPAKFNILSTSAWRLPDIWRYCTRCKEIIRPRLFWLKNQPLVRRWKQKSRMLQNQLGLIGQIFAPTNIFYEYFVYTEIILYPPRATHHH